MKLLFLGAAQDGSVPQAGCRCANCRTVKRTAASIALIDETKAVLIDITPDFRLQYDNLIKRFDVELEAVYLTHAHWGHYGGLPLLGKEGWNVQGLPLYLAQRFHTFLTTNEPFNTLFEKGNVVAEIIAENIATRHGITPIRVPHRGEYSETFAFVIKMNNRLVLYLPDTDEFTPALGNLIRGVDLAIIDGTFYDDSELPQRDISLIPHPLVKNSMKEFADIADRIIFTHLNHSNPLLNSESAEYIGLKAMRFRVAVDGDLIE